jgi:cytochrome c oxidase subunit 2
MKRTRYALALPLAAVALAVLAAPAAAQGASTSARLINDLNGRLLIVAIPITILVEGILIYTVLKFRNADEASPTKENRRLEITWTVATAIILLFVGVASYGVLADPAVTLTQEEADSIPDDAVVVNTHAYQWNWNMTYPEEGIRNLQGSDTGLTESSGPVIVVPEGREVYFRVTAEEVLHAVHVPELGLKQDAIPGQTNTIKTTPTEVGEYQGYCAEYCGVGHSQMYFKVVVVPEDTYEQFLANQGATSASGSDSGSESANASVSPADATVAP